TCAVTLRAPTFIGRLPLRWLRFHTASVQRTTSAAINPSLHGIHFGTRPLFRHLQKSASSDGAHQSFALGDQDVKKRRRILERRSTAPNVKRTASTTADWRPEFPPPRRLTIFDRTD